MTESVLLVLVSFGFGFMAGALCGTLFIGWMAWRAVSGLAAMGATIRESKQHGAVPFQNWGSRHPET